MLIYPFSFFSFDGTMNMFEYPLNFFAISFNFFNSLIGGGW
jgi:hypothetical protein